MADPFLDIGGCLPLLRPRCEGPPAGPAPQIATALVDDLALDGGRPAGPYAQYGRSSRPSARRRRRRA